MRYIVKLNKEMLQKKFESNTLTFSIGNVKSTTPILITPFLRLYNYRKEEIAYYKATPFCVGLSYSKKFRQINISQEDLSKCVYFDVGMIFDGVEYETALKMNRLMLNEGDVTDYHQPLDLLPETTITFNNNFYAILYDKGGETSLQIIRPNYDSFTTNRLTASKCTVLVPHIKSELLEDHHQNVGLEYMNMSDQTIEILR